MERFNRVKLLIGSSALEKLQNCKVALFGIGGVGGFTAEALVRSGIGAISLFDNDTVAKTNLNRQIIATEQTLGMDKVQVMKERLLSINPNVKVECNKVFYLPENAKDFDFSGYDYVIDAVDTVSAKLEIIERAKASGVPVISCMGTGGKLDATKLKIADIKKTNGCPLARVVRRELKKRGVDGVKVVYSEEERRMDDNELDVLEVKGKNRVAPPSMIFVPSVAGILLAQEVVSDLITRKGE